jgi:hypothetical protein
MQEIKLYKSKSKALWLMLLCCPFIAASVYDLWFYDDMMPNELSWLGLCFFGSGIPLGLLQIFDKRPQVIINETGIFDRTAYKDFINWNVITDAYITKVYSQEFICLIIKDEVKQYVKGKATLKKLSLALGFQELNISVGNLNINNTDKLAQFILAMSQAAPSNRHNLISHESFN